MQQELLFLGQGFQRGAQEGSGLLLFHRRIGWCLFFRHEAWIIRIELGMVFAAEGIDALVTRNAENPRGRRGLGRIEKPRLAPDLDHGFLNKLLGLLGRAAKARAIGLYPRGEVLKENTEGLAVLRRSHSAETGSQIVGTEAVFRRVMHRLLKASIFFRHRGVYHCQM